MAKRIPTAHSISCGSGCRNLGSDSFQLRMGVFFFFFAQSQADLICDNLGFSASGVCDLSPMQRRTQPKERTSELVLVGRVQVHCRSNPGRRLYWNIANKLHPAMLAHRISRTPSALGPQPLLEQAEAGGRGGRYVHLGQSHSSQGLGFLPDRKTDIVLSIKPKGRKLERLCRGTMIVDNPRCGVLHSRATRGRYTDQLGMYMQGSR